MNISALPQFRRFQAKSRYQWATSSWKTALLRRDDSSAPNLVTTLVGAGLSPETALSEATENLGPGTDTTSATLAHILHALAYNPQFQTELFADLMNARFPTNLSSLEKIPKLQACVKEGIRWTGAAAAMLPRVVPEPGVELLGRYIPGGVSQFLMMENSELSILPDRPHDLADMVSSRLRGVSRSIFIRSIPLVDCSRRCYSRRLCSGQVLHSILQRV